MGQGLGIARDYVEAPSHVPSGRVDESDGTIGWANEERKSAYVLRRVCSSKGCDERSSGTPLFQAEVGRIGQSEGDAGDAIRSQINTGARVAGRGK
jgi:hypothetical protein